MAIDLNDKQTNFIKNELLPFASWLHPEHGGVKFLKGILSRGQYDEWDKEHIDTLIESYKVFYPNRKQTKI